MSETVEKIKRLPKETVKLQFAGDLVLANCQADGLDGYFRRFETLFETMANFGREDRILRYKMLNALMLTSHAKKETVPEKKKELFDQKNKIYIDIANHPEYRRKVAFKYLTANRPRVIKYCDACEKKNSEEGLKKYKWKHCKSCEVDPTFFNVVSMYHKFDEGSICIFLSQDMIGKLPFKKFKNTGKLTEFKEEALLGQFRYTIKNLDSIQLESVQKMYELIKDK